MTLLASKEPTDESEGEHPLRLAPEIRLRFFGLVVCPVRNRARPEGQLSGKTSTNPKCLIYVLCKGTHTACELPQKGLELFILALELLNPFLHLPAREGIDTFHVKHRTLLTGGLLASTPNLALTALLTGAFHSSPRGWLQCRSNARYGHFILVNKGSSGMLPPLPSFQDILVTVAGESPLSKV